MSQKKVLLSKALMLVQKLQPPPTAGKWSTGMDCSASRMVIISVLQSQRSGSCSSALKHHVHGQDIWLFHTSWLSTVKCLQNGLRPTGLQEGHLDTKTDFFFFFESYNRHLFHAVLYPALLEQAFAWRLLLSVHAELVQEGWILFTSFLHPVPTHHQ